MVHFDHAEIINLLLRISHHRCRENSPHTVGENLAERSDDPWYRVDAHKASVLRFVHIITFLPHSVRTVLAADERIRTRVQSKFQTLSRRTQRNSRVGLASASGTPKVVRLGPIPRRMRLSFPPLSPRMKPAMTMSEPVLTKARVLILPSLEAAWPRS